MNFYVGSSFGAKGSSGNSRCTFPISVSLSGKAAAPLDHMPVPQLATFLSVTLVYFLYMHDLSSLYNPFRYAAIVLALLDLINQLFRDKVNFLKKKKKEKECGNLDIAFPLFHQKNSIMLEYITKDYMPYH